nr:hypothetical protein [Tanacetum cinerariifolium]
MFRVRGRVFPLQSLSLYAPLPNASVTSYSPSHLVLQVSMPISTGITTSVLYVSENGVSPLLDLIIVRCAHKRCKISSIQFLLLSSNCALIPSPKLLFVLSTKPLACRWAKLVDAILLRASAFLFSPRYLFDGEFFESAYEVFDFLQADCPPWHVEVFTLSSWVWNVIPVDLPDSLKKGWDVSVSKLRESLVVSGYISLAREGIHWGVWVMENNSSFTKLFTFGTSLK